MNYGPWLEGQALLQVAGLFGLGLHHHGRACLRQVQALVLDGVLG